MSWPPRDCPNKPGSNRNRSIHHSCGGAMLGQSCDAVAMFEGPETGLAVLRPLEQPLAGHHRLHAIRVHLLKMVGGLDAAFAQYQTAANRTTNLPEGTT